MSRYYLQKTLETPVTFQGIGVHSGKNVTVTVHPARENHGIKFRRVDLPGTLDIQAIFNLVVDTSLATVIGNNGAIVSTIEHLMAAFAGLKIDNALIEIDEYEVPVMDGSAKAFTRGMVQAGIRQQNAPKHFFVVKEPITVRENGKSVSVYPETAMRITCRIEFDHPLIGCQEASFDPDRDSFKDSISCARTFGFVQDLDYLKKFSLGRGGSLENAVVIDSDRILNSEGLRYPDEFVRHKLLDSLGDFSLLGMPILGHISTDKSGHALNHAFINKFLTEKEKWETRPVQKKTPA